MTDLRFRMLPDARRWPCRFEGRCTTPAVAVVIAGKLHVPTCLLHLVDLVETPPAGAPGN